MKRLAGRVVAVTRDGDPDDRLVALLEAEGARVVVWPTLAFEPPADDAPLRNAAATLAENAWVLFTSRRAVTALSDLVPDPPANVRVAAVGIATAAAATRCGWNVCVTGDLDAEGMARRLASTHDLRGSTLLFPAASLAGEALEQALAELGARVHRVEAYRTVEVPPPADRVREDLERGVDFVTFASPSAVRALATCLGGGLSELGAVSQLVAIGPSTVDAIRQAKVTEVLVASRPGLEGLVEACATRDLATR